MRAAVLHGPLDLKIEDVPEPQCGPDEIIIKVQKASICNSTDVHIWDGTFPEEARPAYPHILGHENSGEVVEVGEELRGEYKIGDRIGFWCKMSGGFAEYNNIKPRQLAVTKLSKNLKYEEGSLLEIIGGTLRCFHDSGIKIGQKVLILGQGPCGLLFTQLALLFGASRVYTLDLFNNRLELSKKYGSNLAYNLTGKDYETALSELKNIFQYVDVVIDTIGKDLWQSGNVRNLALYLLRRHGSYIVWGHPTENAVIDLRRISNEDIILRGFEPGMQKSNELIKFGEELLSSQRINVTEMITNHITLDDLEKGLKLCKNNHDEVIKIVVDIVP